MCFLWRSPITRSPELTSGDFIFNTVIAGSGMLEIGARQLNNWRLHEPPDFLPFCQPGALSTRLYCSWMPRHHFRLPGRYSFQVSNFPEFLYFADDLLPILFLRYCRFYFLFLLLKICFLFWFKKQLGLLHIWPIHKGRCFLRIIYFKTQK